MAIATFRRIRVDSTAPATAGPFWATILGLRWQPDESGDGGLYDASGRCAIWIDQVDALNLVKRRVHLDMYASSLSALIDLGSRVVLPEGDDRRWTIMADPEGGEYCAFLRADPPRETLHGLVIDCADYAAQARWWATLYGGQVTDADGFSTVTGVDGVTFTMDFTPVPEAKSGRNSIRWDVTARVDDLLAAGATVVREPAGTDGGHLLADPEGNEFAAFPP
jgi:Glyoxalase-like domain